MERSFETTRTKPALAPKPRVTPKPFSLQQNTAFRSITAPNKSPTSIKWTREPKITSISDPLSTPVQKPPSSPSNPNKNQLPKKDNFHFSEGKPDVIPQITETKEVPKPEPIQKDEVASVKYKVKLRHSEHNLDKKENDPPVSPNHEEADNDGSSPPLWGGARKRLSAALKSKFESGGPPPLPQPTLSHSATHAKVEIKKPESPSQGLSEEKPTPSNRESNEDSVKEDYTGGNSIKRRISLLFDSSSRPEILTKKEEPDLIHSIGDVKARIKNWTSEKSFEPATSPIDEKPSANIPSPTVDLNIPPAEQPAKIQAEMLQELPEEKSMTTQVKHPNHSPSVSTTDSQDSPAIKSTMRTRTTNGKRRSVRFGTVQRDDGGPPLILGSTSESSTDEENEDTQEDEPKEGMHTSSKSVGNRQKNDDELQSQEEDGLNHHEFEKRRRAEEHDQAKHNFEEMAQEEERARQKELEELKLREEERKRVIEREERERQRMEEENAAHLREQEREKMRLREEEMERERQLELSLQRERERERERAQLEEDKSRQERERLKQEERERERIREERERQRQMTLQKERERARQAEEDLRQVEKEKERLRVEAEERELRRRLEEEERMRQRLRREEEEMKRRKELERQMQQEREQKLERQKTEEDIERRQRELEMEKKLKEEELERKQRELEIERMRREEELERMQMELEMERKRREEELERKQLELEMERRKREEEMDRKQKELERMKREEEMDRMKREEEMERMRQIDIQREVEQRRQMEEESAREQEKVWQYEEEIRKKEEIRKMLQSEEEQRRNDLWSPSRAKKDNEDDKLNYLESKNETQRSNSLRKPYESVSLSPVSPLIDVAYDDFSVRKPVMELEFDDFSVKPRLRGTQPKLATPAVTKSWLPDLDDNEEANQQVPLEIHSHIRADNRDTEQIQENPKEEEDDSKDVEAVVEKEQPPESHLVYFHDQEERETKDTPDKKSGQVVEEDKLQVEINSPQSDDKDTEALIEPAQDLQEVLSDHEQERESPVVVPDYVPEGFSDDPNTTDSHEEPEFPPFPESTTPLLDTSTLRSKVDLGRRRSRARPTRSFRVGLNQPERQDWRAHDSSVETRTSVKLSDSDSDEEQPKRSISRSPSTSQKVPAFPGVSPAALIAQLKKRTPSGGTGRGEQTEEDKSGEEKENQDEEVAAAPAPLPRSPRTASRLAGAALVLPPLGSKDGGAVASPAWLKELKSKKRSSHHDGVV